GNEVRAQLLPRARPLQRRTSFRQRRPVPLTTGGFINVVRQPERKDPVAHGFVFFQASRSLMRENHAWMFGNSASGTSACLAYMSEEASVRSASVMESPTTYCLPSRRLFNTAAKRWKLAKASSTLLASGAPMPIMGLMILWNTTVPICGEKCVESQNCQRVTSARTCSSRGSRPVSGFLDVRYCMMALDSVSTKSPSTSGGTAPFGLSAKYSGVLCSPLAKSSFFSSSWSPSTAAVRRTRRTLGDIGLM